MVLFVLFVQLFNLDSSHKTTREKKGGRQKMCGQCIIECEGFHLTC